MGKRACPGCGDSLVRVASVAGVSGERCGTCNGLVLSAGLKGLEELLAEVPELESGEVAIDPDLQCPNDGEGMNEEFYAEAGGIAMARCSACFSLWLAATQRPKMLRLASGEPTSRILRAVHAAAFEGAGTDGADESNGWDPAGVETWIPTHFDAYFLGALLPAILVPLIVLIGVADDEAAAELMPIWILGGIALVYTCVWIGSRVAGERRIGIGKSSVWLPPINHRLRGRAVSYRDLRSITRYGTADRSIAIRFDGGTRRYSHNVVDVARLEKELRPHIPKQGVRR